MEFKYRIFLLNISMHVNVILLIQCINLSKVLYGVCPDSDICNRPRSHNNESEIQRCSSSCSCDEKCGLRLDCCFDHIDKYKLVQKGKASCIGTVIRNTNNNNANMKRYLMIHACGIDDLDTSDNNVNIHHCRLKDKNGESLIAPVSSLETNLIYVNKECAACNKINMTRIKLWNYFGYVNIASNKPMVTEIQGTFENEFQQRNYVAPTDENWSHRLCYNKYVGECVAGNRWTNMCNHLRASLLQQFTHLVYQNAFCFSCTGTTVISVIQKVCPSPGRDKPSTPVKGGMSLVMTLLLDTSVIEASRLFDSTKVTGISKSKCPAGHMEAYKETCLVIFCPEGMLRTHEGCTYFALRWYPHKLLLQVKLIPVKGSRLSVANLQTCGCLKDERRFSWLEVPCRQVEFTHFRVFYSTAVQDIEHTATDNSTTDYISELVVRIWTLPEKNTGVDPSSTIPLVYKCISNNWKVKLNNKTYVFDASFYKYDGYIQDGQQILEKWPGENFISSDFEISARPALYTYLGNETYEDKGDNVTVLKKPFFCNTVRVPLSDVEIRFGEILIISKNVSLGTNEYIVNKPNEKGGVNEPDWNRTTFSVCINDYDPRYVDALGRSTKFTCSLSVTFINIFLISNLILKA